MCGEETGEQTRPEIGAPATGVDRPVSRRSVLQGGAAAALGAVVLGRPGAAGAAPASVRSFTGADPLVAAMHVHASYSEGESSWEQQYVNCVAAGADVLWHTDHDFRARARNYMTTLRGTFLGSTTGTPAQRAATFAAGGAMRLLVESGGSSPASQRLTMEEKPTAVNTFRTGIDGQTLRHAFGASRLDAGALYEVVVTLSRHPAQGGRAAGIYSLRYRFGRGVPAGRFTEGGGLVGVVQAAMPADGATVTLNPQVDIATIWPSMIATDNVSYLLAFSVTSPRRGVVADVRVRSVTVNRVRHDAAGIIAAQQQMVNVYAGRYDVAGFVSEEVSLGVEEVAHCNVFGSAPEFSLKTGINAGNWSPYYRDMIARAHSRGGVVSWNHPFGASGGAPVSPAQQVQLRNQVFAARWADRFLGADVLEVGYSQRGGVSFATHVDLWDIFTRRALWLTGNGASDDHSGLAWRGLINGFLTGLWAASSSQAALTAALRSGRAYTFHPGRTPGLQLDTLVDGAVAMGRASVSGAASRTVAVFADNVPADCTVEVLRGPVDLTGNEPGVRTVVGSWAGSAFNTAGGTVSTSVDTSTGCFVRAQVRRNGVLVATGNPTWLLRQPPPGGIPAARAA